MANIRLCIPSWMINFSTDRSPPHILRFGLPEVLSLDDNQFTTYMIHTPSKGLNSEDIMKVRKDNNNLW
jgi:hypothetical protein